MGSNIDLSTKSFAFLDRYRFKTTEWCKARITALALPDRTSNSLFCLLSLVISTPRYLNFSTCFHDTLPTCREHGQDFSKDVVSQFWKFSFIPAMSHAAAKPFMRVGGQIQRKPAILNHLRKAAD